MAIFIAITITISANKAVTFSNDKKTVEGFELEPLGSQETLFAYLQSPQEDNKTMQDFIEKSLDSYIEDETGIYFASWKLWDKSVLKQIDGDINKIWVVRTNPTLSKEFLMKVQDKEKILILNSQEILGESCEEYMLQLPQGVILNNKEDFVSEEEIKAPIYSQEILIRDWGEWATVNFYYKGHFIEIKYKQLRKC